MKAIRKPLVFNSLAGAAAETGARARVGAGGSHPDTLTFARILAPTDFSDPSRKALIYAARMAGHFSSRVTLIHVLEPVMSPDFTNFPLALDEDKVVEAARQRLMHLGRSILGERLIESAVIRQGSPFHEISDAARELKMDLIIMATHGYSGLKRALLGSTAERVVRYAPCAVMTVR
jgi:universal stress protein A